MLFWILYLCSLVFATFIAMSLSTTIIGAIGYWILFTTLFMFASIVIVMWLSLFFSTWRMQKEVTIYPLVRLDEDTITYRDEDDFQITISRDCISRIKNTDVMDKLEIIEYYPHKNVAYWLWDLVERECEYNLLLRQP